MHENTTPTPAACESYAYTKRRGGCGSLARTRITVTFAERPPLGAALCGTHARCLHEDLADPLFAYLRHTSVEDEPIVLAAFLSAFCAGALRRAAWWEAEAPADSGDRTPGRAWETVESFDLGNLRADQREDFRWAAERFLLLNPEAAGEYVDAQDAGGAWWMALRGNDAAPGLDFSCMSAFPPALRERLNLSAAESGALFGAVRLDERTGTLSFAPPRTAGRSAA